MQIKDTTHQYIMDTYARFPLTLVQEKAYTPMTKKETTISTWAQASA